VDFMPTTGELLKAWPNQKKVGWAFSVFDFRWPPEIRHGCQGRSKYAKTGNTLDTFLDTIGELEYDLSFIFMFSVCCQRLGAMLELS